MVFADEPYAVVESALMAFVSSDTKGFAPAPGALKAIIAQTATESQVTPMAAWGLVSKALKNSLYGYKDEFAKLPQDVQTAIGCAEQLRDWALLP